MKILPSGFMHEDSPVPDGMDLALAFAHANQPVIDSFLKQQRSDLEKSSTNLQTLREKKAYFPGAIVAGISTVISIVAFGNGTQSGLSFLPFGLAGIIGGTSLGYVMVDRQEKSVLKLEQELQEIPRRPIPQTVSHLGKVHYVVNVLPFADGNIVVDATGRRQKQSMVYPEIPNVIHQLKSLQTQLTKIPNELPILLPGGDPSDLQARSRLRGVEADMGDILSMTNRIFDGTVDISAEIPVFPVRSNMVQSIRSASSHLIDGEPQFHLAKPDPSIEKAVNSISQTSAEIVEIRKSGLPDVKSLMSESVHRMDSCITQAKISRDKSLMNILSQSLEHINDIYDYPLTHFYCPKCHQTEQQRIANLPVSPDQLVEVPVEVLDSLHRSQDLRTLRRVMDNIRRNISQAEVDEQGHDSENTTILQTRLETYQNRLQGLAVEIPEFDPQIDRHKRNAVLKYNTLQKKWTCQLCSESFSDEQAQWARMLKVKDDLILPIWDSLWLEKHDERNRIIREKETELRGNVEEESKLLRDEAKLFTEEFRPVRDQLESMGSGSRVARQQIDMMLNFYMIRGIMSEQVAQEMRQYMNLANGRTTEDVIELTRQLEAQLADDAEIVALNRHQLSDYADEVRNATKYFTTIEPLKTLTQKQDS